MFSAALLLFGILRSPKLLLVAILAGFLAYFAVPRVQTRISGITDPDDSAKLRLVSWSRAVEISSQSPIFGVGFNLYRQAQERFGFFDYRDFSGGHAGGGSDSSLLLVLATTGVVGLILFLLTFVNIFIRSLTKIKTHTGLILALSLFGLLVDSQFINSLFFPQIMLWIWVLVGLQ
jgi:O-antigen ligase